MFRLAAALEAGREDFLSAAGGAAAKRASARPHADAWSVLECIEHVITVEARYLDWILNGEPAAPNPDSEKELRIFTIIRSRLTPVETPKRLRPHGRFRTLEAALAEFNGIRDRSVELARDRGAALYAIRATHPYFGSLNGGELLQLIDGHARRHADQIREILEATHVPTKPASSRQRERPDLPAQFDSTELPDPSGSELFSIQEQHLLDRAWPKLPVDALRIEGSVLERVHFAEGRWGSVSLKDARLEGCDWANLRARRMTLVRVEMIDCRLTGLHADALDWRDVLIQKADLSYVQMQGGKFRNCEFENCNLQEADLKDADLSGAIVRGCNLAGADLNRARLHSADLRGSELDGMLAGVNDLQGAIVDPAQAMVLAKLLGLQIR